MNVEIQVAILTLIVVVPVAIFWALKTKPSDDSFYFPPHKKKRKKKKNNYVYDVNILQRYGKRYCMKATLDLSPRVNLVKT